MNVHYEYLRPERAKDFNLEHFKNSIEGISDFNEQLELWNKLFDLLSMGRKLSVMEINLVNGEAKEVYCFYCESGSSIIGSTPEKQDILTNWIKKNKQISIETWIKTYIDSPYFNKEKTFEYLKKDFEERLPSMDQPKEVIQEEITFILEKYYMPNKFPYKELEDIQNSQYLNERRYSELKPKAHILYHELIQNAHILAFTDLKRGRLFDDSRYIKLRILSASVFKLIEGEQAYKYYKYLCGLRKNISHLDELNTIAFPSTSESITANNAPNYKTLFDLFYKPDDFIPCINALRKIQPPVINETGNWIGRRGSKSILVAWIERLEFCNKIHSISSRRDLVPLLNNQFPNLKMGIDARTFGQITNTQTQYKSEFAALILP